MQQLDTSVAGFTVKQSLFKRLLRVWPYFSQARGAWALAIVATVVASATEPFIPAMLKPLLDRGFQQGELKIWLVPLTLMTLFTVRGLAVFLAQYAMARITNDGLLKLRQAMFAKMLSARLSLFSEQSASALANTVVYEVFNGSSELVNALLKLARDVLTLVALVSYLLYLNWKLSLIVALLFPAVAWVIRVLSRRIYQLTRQSQGATDKLAYVVEENVAAHRDIRLHGAEQAQAERFGVLSQTLRLLSLKGTAAYAGMSAITQILAAIALSAVITIALLQTADNSTTVGGFAAFVTAMLLLIAPIKGLSDVATPVTRGLAALERGLDLLENNPDETTGSFSKKRCDGTIGFQDVSAAYTAGGSLSLDGVNLQIRAGETIAIVGASGAGKTTLVNLLARFTNQSSGAVLLDGVDIREWSLACLREQIAYVSQHVVLLNTSVAENVALGSQPLDRQRVEGAIAAANLMPFVSALPQGMDTVLGHNGMNLSGGQRQRLAIARALYKDAPVLVLDEATSALDSESEMAVQQALIQLAKNRTSLVIAHRLSTVQHADRIVVLDAGRIVEVGSHTQLLAANGAYAHLYRLGFAKDKSETAK